MAMENELTKVEVSLPTANHVWEKMRQHGEKPKALESLIGLYQRDRDLFFGLASIGVPKEAPLWARNLADLAARVRYIVRHGYQVVPSSNGHVKIVAGQESLRVPKIESASILSFLHLLNGTAIGRETVNYEGEEVSSEEVEFSIGGEIEQKAVSHRIDALMNSVPVVLKLDEQDRHAVEGGMPGYVVYGLRHCASRIVQNPAVVFEGIRIEGQLKEGFAYSGLPKHQYDNAGTALPHPADMVYIVYVDAENYVFDWDWVRADTEKPGYPIGWRKRFERQAEKIQEAVLIEVESLSVGEFRRENAWYSVRGDCMFWYSTDDPTYADRINDDLTVFKTFAADKIVGCKLKNISRTVSSLRKEMASLLEARARFKSILGNSLVRQTEKGAPQRDYSAYKDVFGNLEEDTGVCSPFPILGIQEIDSELVTS